MSKMMEFALNIQAKLDSTYESNFNKANGAINAMDSELVGLQKTQKDIANYTKLKDSIKNTKNETQLAGQKLGLFRAELEASKNQTKLAAKSMSEARKEVMELSREFDNADNPTKEMANALKIAESNLKTLTKEHGKIKNSTKTLTTSVKTAEKRVGKLNQKWKDQAIKLRSTKQGLDKAKISTKNLTAENKKISASMDKVIQKQKTMNKLQNIKNKIMNPMVGAVAGAVSVGILVSKANESIAKSSSFNEIQTKFDQVFKSYSDSANNWADSYAHDMNMSIVQTKESMGDIQNLFTGFGMDRGDSFGLSKEIIELANDLDSFNNLTDKGVDAQKTMISALMGETESAKTLGASILESNLNVASAALGYGKYSSKMDEAMKIQIRFKAIQMQSKDAIGDVTRNLDSEVGLTRKKNALLEKQQLLIGSTLMPLQMKWLNLQIGALTFMSENFDAIVATTQVLASLAAGYGAMKIIGVITTLIQGKTKAEIFAATITKSQIAIQAAYNTVLMANPIGLVVGGLVALVGIGIVVYKNFDKIKAKTLALWEAYKDNPIARIFYGMVSPILVAIDALQTLYHWYKKFTDGKDISPDQMSKSKGSGISIAEKGQSKYNQMSKAQGSSLSIPAYAKGGVVNNPHMAIVGDGRTPESIIPHDGSARSRGLWKSAGEKMGLLGSNSSSNINQIEIKIDFKPVIQGGNTEGIIEALRKESGPLRDLIKNEVQKAISGMTKTERRTSFG